MKNKEFKFPELVATVGYSFSVDTIEQLVKKLLNINIRSFRFNLSKCFSSSDIKRHLNTLAELKKRNKQMRIMLDIPYPCQKPRIISSNITFMNENDRCYLISKMMSNEVSYIKVNYNIISDIFEVGDILWYMDGRHSFEVTNKISADCIEIKARESLKIEIGRSICNQKLIFKKQMESDIVKKINDLSPESVALSFVSSSEDVLNAKRLFPKTTLISKIESIYGVNKIEEICRVSDVMIARGDLILNIPITDLHLVQKYISSVAHKFNRKVYVATGIFTSLSSAALPNQAEMIDAVELLNINSDGLILNAGVAKGNIEQVKTILESLVEVKKNETELN